MLLLDFGPDGCFKIAISGLSSMCGKSRERCNWTFYGATCKFLEGINADFCFCIMDSIYNLNGENLYVKGNFCTLQHRRKTQKSGFWSGSTAMLGKELPRRGREDLYDSAPDPLLSPFICSISFAEPKGTKQDECSSTDAPKTTEAKRYSPILCKAKSKGVSF